MDRTVFAFLLAAGCVVGLTSGDIVGSDPPDGSCLCPATNDLYVRETPCGNVSEIIGINDCYRYTGNSSKCTLDIEYEFFQIDLDGQFGWIVGNYLILEPSAHCSEFPCGAPAPGFFESHVDGRILAGQDTARNMFPWQLAIEEDADGSWVLACGATLIDAYWAVTAAHCVAFLESSSKPLRLVAGVWNRSEEIDQTTQIRNVNWNHVIVHPDFNSSSLANDIALLHIPDPYNISESSIRTICLPPTNTTEYYENPSCYLTGWGVTERLGGDFETPEILQQTGIDVIQPKNCATVLDRPMRDAETCTFDQASRTASACKGDLGGPLSCAINTRFHLAAVGSYTVDITCDPEFPQIYMSVPYFLNWIKEETGLLE